MPRMLTHHTGPDGTEWIRVAVANGEAQAAIIIGLLESAQIPVLVFRESAGSALAMNVGLLGSTTIMVPEAYYAEALQLLEADDPLMTDSQADDVDFEADQPLDEA